MCFGEQIVTLNVQDSILGAYLDSLDADNNKAKAVEVLLGYARTPPFRNSVCTDVIDASTGKAKLTFRNKNTESLW